MGSLTTSKNLVLFIAVFLESTEDPSLDECTLILLDQLRVKSYRDRMTTALRDRLGLDLSFEDIRLPSYATRDLDVDWDRVRRLDGYLNPEFEEIDDVQFADELWFVRRHVNSAFKNIERLGGEFEAALARLDGQSALEQ